MSEKKLLSEIIDEVVREAEFLPPIPGVKEVIKNVYKFFLMQ